MCNATYDVPPLLPVIVGWSCREKRVINIINPDTGKSIFDETKEKEAPAPAPPAAVVVAAEPAPATEVRIMDIIYMDPVPKSVENKDSRFNV